MSEETKPDDQPTTSEQIAEIEGQAADYTPPEGWRVLQPGEALQPGDAWAHPQADLFEENLNLTGVAGKHGYYLRRIKPDPEPQPVQVREGRWRTRGGEIRHVTPTPKDYPYSNADRHSWHDARHDQTWYPSGRYTVHGDHPLDLVEYLGAIEPAPEPQPEPEPEPQAEYTPPEGWRLLQIGEVIQRGDLFLAVNGEHWPAERIGEAVNDNRYIRRIEPEQTITPDDATGLVGQQLIRGLVLQVAEAIEATEQPQPEPESPAGSNAEQRVKLLKHANNTQAETIGRLQDEVRDLRTELAEATQERYAQTARIGHLEAINSTHAETIAGLHAEIHGLNMEIGGLQRERTQKDDRIGYLETMNSGQAAAVRAAGEQNTQLRTLADNARRQLEAAADEISDLRQALDNAEKQLDQKDARICDLQIELDAAQQVVQPLTDEQREQIWDEATEQAGEQLIRWLQPLVHALKQQPDERFLRFMAITLSVLPNIVPGVLGYAEDERGEDVEE